MSRSRARTRFMDDQRLALKPEQIAHREATAPAMPYLLEAADRLQARDSASTIWRNAGRWILGLTG